MTTDAAPITRPSRRRRNRAPYFLLIHSIALLIIGTEYPIAWQLITSLRKYGMAQQFGQPADFVWFENYQAILKDPAMWGVVVRSVVFAVAVGLLIALLMRRVWIWLFDRRRGVINWLLDSVGIH